MKIKRLVCLALAALMLVSCIIPISAASAEAAGESGGDTTVVGIVIICVAVLGIAGGIVVKVLQKKKRDEYGADVDDED